MSNHSFLPRRIYYHIQMHTNTRSFDFFLQQYSLEDHIFTKLHNLATMSFYLCTLLSYLKVLIFVPYITLGYINCTHFISRQSANVFQLKG